MRKRDDKVTYVVACNHYLTNKGLTTQEMENAFMIGKFIGYLRLNTVEGIDEPIKRPDYAYHHFVKGSVKFLEYLYRGMENVLDWFDKPAESWVEYGFEGQNSIVLKNNITPVKTPEVLVCKIIGEHDIEVLGKYNQRQINSIVSNVETYYEKDPH